MILCLPWLVFCFQQEEYLVWLIGNDHLHECIASWFNMFHLLIFDGKLMQHVKSTVIGWQAASVCYSFCDSMAFCYFMLQLLWLVGICLQHVTTPLIGPVFCYRLRLFQKFDPFRILVCGGDGSIGWVLSEIDKLDLHKQVINRRCLLIELKSYPLYNYCSAFVGNCLVTEYFYVSKCFLLFVW